MHQCAYTCLNRSLDMENSTIITPLNWEHKESVKYTYVKSYVPSLYICYIVSYTKHSSKVISQWHATLVAVSITDRGNVIESSTLPLRNCYTEEKIVKTCRSNVFFFFFVQSHFGMKHGHLTRNICYSQRTLCRNARLMWHSKQWSSVSLTSRTRHSLPPTGSSPKSVGTDLLGSIRRIARLIHRWTSLTQSK